MTVIQIINTNIIPISAYLCSFVAAILGAFMSYIKRGGNRPQIALFAIAAQFFLGAFIFGAIDRITNNSRESEQKDAIKKFNDAISKSISDLKYETGTLILSIKMAQDSLSKSSEDIEGISKSSSKLSADLDKAKDQIASSIDSTGQQMAVQIKQYSFLLEHEMRTSRAVSKQQIEDFATNSNENSEELIRQMRKTAQDIRNNQNTNTYDEYGYSQYYNDKSPLYRSNIPHYSMPLNKGAFMLN